MQILIVKARLSRPLHSFYPLAAGGGGLVIFRNFPLEGGLENFWSTGGAGPLGRGAPKSRWAKDFDIFGKNVLEKFSKIE